MKTPYSISMTRDLKYYHLSSMVRHDDWAAYVKVRVDYSEENNSTKPYIFIPCKNVIGDEVELWTKDDFGSKRYAVEMNEGEDAAVKWENEKVGVFGEDRYSNHIVNLALPDLDNTAAWLECQNIIEHFLHVVKLGLINLGPTA